MNSLALVTGFPTFASRRMARKLLEAESRAQVILLTREAHAAEAETFRTSFGASRRKRMRILTGDVTAMHLGLAGDEYRHLTQETTSIYHFSSVRDLAAPRQVMEDEHVSGTRNLLELATECTGLGRLVYLSTCQVSGDRRGVILEEELELGQRFRNPYEETKYQAERLVRAAIPTLPITIVRPGILVGDSKTGEIDRFDGPYYLIVLIVASPAGLRLPLPGRGNAPLHLVPIDFVIDATYRLAQDQRACGRTFHLVDPCPMSARHIYDLVAKRASKKPTRRARFPTRLARTLLRAPGLERLGRAPLAFLESLDHHVFYNCQGTLELLHGTLVRCPAFDSYVDALIRYVREVHEVRQHGAPGEREPHEALEDALDTPA